jgi:hypothetical protein
MVNELHHELTKKSEYFYGYVFIRKDETKKFIKLCSLNPFTVLFEGRLISNRKHDLKRNRINLYPLRKSFHEGDILIFKRNKDAIEIILKPKKV